MKKYLVIVICFYLSLKSQSQFNYSFTNTVIDTTAFVDISTIGTPIAMTDSVSGNSTTPQNIRFNFSFNNTSFTQFMIHTNGVLQFGSTAPLAATTITTTPGIAYGNVFANTATTYQNMLMPFYCDVRQGMAAPQYHVLNTGIAPNRICTIQWKNLRDPDNANSSIQHQFENLSFQVRLFEGSNNIEFVYGNIVSSPNINASRNVAVGIKNNATNFIAMYKPASSATYSNIEFLNPASNAVVPNQWTFQKNNLMPEGYTLRFLGQQANDVNIAELYVDNSIIVNSISNKNIKALIKNEGTAIATNVGVNLMISGANTLSEMVTITSLAAGAQQVVSFSNFTPSNVGTQEITISVTGAIDNVSENNSKSITQKVNQSFFQNIATDKYANLGVGINGSTGMIAVKIRNSGVKKIAQIRFGTVNNLVPMDVRVFEDNGVNNSPGGSALFSSSAFYTSSDNELIVTLQPALTVTDNFYVSFTQRNSTNMGIKTALQLPQHPQTFYTSDIFGTTWAEQSDTRPFAPIVKVFEQASSIDVGIDSLLSPRCSYTNNETVTFKINNFSNTVHDLSLNPITIQGTVTNFVTNITTPFSVTQSTGIIPAGGRLAVDVLSNFDFSSKGYYLFTAKTICTGDTESLNDSLRYNVLTNISVTKNPSDSTCPFGTTVLTVNTFNVASPNWFLDRNYTSLFSSGNTANVFMSKTDSVFYIRAVDARNCFLYDSVIVRMKKIIPATPVIATFDSVLSPANGFKNTFEVPSMSGNTISWLGNGVSNADGTLYTVSGFLSSASNLQQVNYVNGSCGGFRDSITVTYKPGVILDNNNPLVVTDTAFYDRGNATGNYTSTQYNLKTFLPSSSNKKVRLSFYHINLGSATQIRIYDGNNINAPLIFSINSSHNGSVERTFTASNIAGELSVEFIGNNTSGRGFLAGLTCVEPLQFRSIADGEFSNMSIWESKAIGATLYSAATRIPSKGDDSIEIRNNIVISTDLPLDQTIVANTGSVTINAGVSLNLYKTTSVAEIIVNGTLTNNGSIRSSSSLAPGSMEVTGSIINNANIDLALTEIVGTSVTQIAGNGTINKLKINNSGGVQVNGNVKIASFLQLQNGIIHVNSTNHILIQASTSATVVGGSSTSYINGKLRQQTFIRDNTDTLFFPVGTNTLFRKIGLVVEQTSFDDFVEYEVQMLNGAPINRTLPTSLSNVNQTWYHHISITNGAAFLTNAQLTLYYQNGDGVTNATNLRIAKDDGGTNWLDIGGTGTANNQGQITSAPFSNFSDFVLANIDASSLPLVWQSLSVLCNRNEATVVWKTLLENNVSHFNILKSKDGIYFEKVGALQANNLSENQYRFIDNNIINDNTAFYKIEQVDRNGAIYYSQIVNAKCKLETNAFNLVPNPAKNKVTLNYIGLNKQQSVSVFDVLGKKVITTTKQQAAIALDISKLKNGVYMVQIVDGVKTNISKLIKQ